LDIPDVRNGTNSECFEADTSAEDSEVGNGDIKYLKKSKKSQEVTQKKIRRFQMM
jgi:hypothetical protein